MEQGTGITCQECGRSNSPGSRFCDSCGRRIDGVCDHCGHQNESGARFCNECGESLSGEAKQAQAAPTLSAPASGAGVCPRCLHRNDAGAQFCYSCGLPLTGERARQAPPTIRAFEHGAPGGFWVRFGAAIIDNIVVGVLIVIIYRALGEDPAKSFMWNLEPAWVLADLIGFIAALLYAPILISLWSTTIGKRCLNLYVIQSDGGRCDFWRALGRTIASILSFLTLGIGFLMIALRADKRALHDLIAGTAVIQRS